MNKKPHLAANQPPIITQAQHAQRRSRFLAQLEPNSVAFFVSPPEAVRSNDDDYKYRQSSDILYLTGFGEPQTVVMLSNVKGEPTFTLFVRPRDKAREIWTGYRAGIEGAKADFDANAAFVIDELSAQASAMLAKATTVYFRPGKNTELDAQIHKAWLKSGKALLNPNDILHEMRLFKAPEEVKMMRHAAKISAEAHCTAMHQCRPGINESQLQAYVHFVFAYRGAPDTAYGTIVAGGNNAVVLHYTKNDQPIRNADLVLIDAGCEYYGYASDITRTFPANGKFSVAQREIYDIVLSAQKAAIAAVKPGVRLSEIHDIARRVLAKGLIDLKILPVSAMLELNKASALPPTKSAKTVKKDPLNLFSFYMHGTSHWLGIDVHDVGNYQTDDGTRHDKGLGKRRILESGMVITVEPGLYFDKNDKRIPKQYRGIGIRIEDDVVVTKTGHDVLTDDVPKEVKEIEALMSAPAEHLLPAV